MDDDYARMAMGMMGTSTSVSDGSTASYYELPTGCTELQHLMLQVYWCLPM